MEHRAIILDNDVNKKALLEKILAGKGPFSFTKDLKGAVFSQDTIDYYLEEEARHDFKVLTADSDQEFKTYSSGEKKKALLKHLINIQPDYLVLDNAFDHLDKSSREILKDELTVLSSSVALIQLTSRKDDILPFIKLIGDASAPEFSWNASLKETIPMVTEIDQAPIPKPPVDSTELKSNLFSFKEVSVRYGDKPVLKNINWVVEPGEYWELSGPNGSGKTTILSMVTGDNPKAYGQDIQVMGYQKGSGESVWDIKKYIGYFSPSMMYRFKGYHSVINMLISGLHDSIGLYVKPTEGEIALSDEWLEVIGMEEKGHMNFNALSEGERRLVMCARAMIKHPPLLILDEPTAALDDNSARLVVRLVNRMASESKTAIIFVSHRSEPGLKAEKHYHLKPTPSGSVGKEIS